MAGTTTQKSKFYQFTGKNLVSVTLAKAASLINGDGGNFYFSFLTLAVVIKIPLFWLLLDSESTIDVFENPDLLTGIHTVNMPMQTTGVGGESKLTYKRGLVPGYRDICLNRDNPANILSLARVKDNF